jgi:uncharacterized membrane protein YjjP (DUF1212 family)
VSAPPTPSRILRVALRVAVAQLRSGAQSDDVEDAVVEVCAAFGVAPVQAAVTFSIISISHDDPEHGPTTLVHIVRDRTTDFGHLAGASAIVRRIGAGELTLDAAEAELDALTTQPQPYSRLVTFLAPGISAAGSTLVFAGTPLDAAATLGIALLLQPAFMALDRATFPPFFRLVFGAFATTVLVTLLAGLGLPIAGGLVLTGSLLRFLPGYALVSGFRDLVGESIMSGSARLAEALLLAAAVAGGTAFGLALAAAFDIQLSIVTLGSADWGLLVGVPAAFVAVAGYTVRLGMPVRTVAGAATLGALAWLLYILLVDVRQLADASGATFLAAIAVGVVGRLVALRARAPAALWVVPAILLLLPGLQLVSAMLAITNAARIDGLLAAATTAFLLGTGVASGDIIVATARRLRERVVVPAVGAVAGGVDVLVVEPVERVADRAAQRLRTRGHGVTAASSTPAQDSLTEPDRDSS